MLRDSLLAKEYSRYSLANRLGYRRNHEESVCEADNRVQSTDFQNG